VKYNFSELDHFMGVVVGKGKANLWIVINPVSFYKFSDGRPREDGKTFLPDGPVSRQAYRKYLTELVNHATNYGRSLSGNPHWNVIRWNLFNEVLSEWNQTFGSEKAPEKYGEFALDSAKILRQLSPKSKVVLGGLGSGADFQEGSSNAKFYIRIFDHFRAANPDYVPFDLFESHWFSPYTEYSRNRKGIEVVKDIQDFLKQQGYGDKQVIIRAGATYTGMDLDEPKRLMDNLQSESQQAEFLLKRFINNFVLGAKAIPWSLIVEHEKYQGDEHKIFCNTGLIYNGYPDLGKCNPKRQQPCPDPGKGVKKLAYYTFKFLIDKVRGVDFDDIKSINTGTPNVYLFQLRRSGKVAYVAWWDYFKEPGSAQKKVMLSLSEIKAANVQVTGALPKLDGAFQTRTNILKETAYPHFFLSRTLPANNGHISLTLDNVPVFVEEDLRNFCQLALSIKNIPNYQNLTFDLIRIDTNPNVSFIDNEPITNTPFVINLPRPASYQIRLYKDNGNPSADGKPPLVHQARIVINVGEDQKTVQIELTASGTPSVAPADGEM